MFNPNHFRQQHQRLQRASSRVLPRIHHQQGLTLIELLVGIVIGLLVIGTAIGTMLLSRVTAGSVTDASQLQQQGSYALRVIGLQLRQTGSVSLKASPAASSLVEYAPAVVLEGSSVIILGTQGSGTASDELQVANSSSTVQNRNCLGQEISGVGTAMNSRFFVQDNQLFCETNVDGNTQKQALISNVTEFRVRYRTKNASGIQILNAGQIDDKLWPAVTAVELCLDLQGDETGNPGNNNYFNCQGESVSRNGRMHLVYHNIFDLRTQRGI